MHHGKAQRSRAGGTHGAGTVRAVGPLVVGLVQLGHRALLPFRRRRAERHVLACGIGRVDAEDGSVDDAGETVRHADAHERRDHGDHGHEHDRRQYAQGLDVGERGLGVDSGRAGTWRAHGLAGAVGRHPALVAAWRARIANALSAVGQGVALGGVRVHAVARARLLGYEIG